MPAMTANRATLAPARRCPGLLLLMLLCLLMVGFVDPFRESVADDDWSYALTVRHLLETGEYRLNAWAAANMPVQIYWGAALAKVFGYSFTTLRFSTLILTFFGLLAFYNLLRDFGSSDTEASLLTLALLASPRLLYLSFSFMTDMQFLSWLNIAFLLYARAIRRHSYTVMALASIAGTGAIGTRQFGVALPMGLVAAWLLNRHRWPNTSIQAVGLALPLLAAVWQISAGLLTPTFTQRVRLAEQLAYQHDLLGMIIQLFWRPIVILQYLGLFLLPLLPLCALLILDRWRARNEVGEGSTGAKPKRKAPDRRRSRLAAWLLYVAIVVGYGYSERGILFPSINGYYLSFLLQKGPVITIPLTCVTTIFAALVGWIVAERYLDASKRKTVTYIEWVVP